MATDGKLTAADKAQVAWYVARMAKRSLAGENVYLGDLQAKADRVIDRARTRQPKK